jgi:hypothetical protein
MFTGLSSDSTIVFNHCDADNEQAIYDVPFQTRYDIFVEVVGFAWQHMDNGERLATINRLK